MLSKFISSVVPLVSILVIAQNSVAQTVEEYTAAMNSEGCKAIPYANWREQCISHQSDVKLWCEGKGSQSCDESGLRSDSFLEKIKNLETAISQAKPEDKSNLEEKKKQAENELGSARKEVQRRLDITQQCIQYRELVQKVFDSAKERVESERSDSNKAAIRDALGKIKDALSAGKPGHETQVREAQTREKYCKSQL